MKTRKNLNNFLVMLVFLLSTLCTAAAGGTLYVPGGYSTIQAAINAATSGVDQAEVLQEGWEQTYPGEAWVDDDYCDGCPNDGHTWGYDAFAKIQDGIDAVASPGTVHVAAGTYFENITLKDAVQLLGASADVTIIDGGGAACVLTADGLGPDTVVDGFTITNGESWDNGGGVYIRNGDLTLTNNVISDNIVTSPHMGGCGGIYAWYSSPIIRDNVVENNIGGAVAISYTSSATVTGNVLTGNDGGISVVDGSFANISDNIVSNNAGGIAIVTDSGIVANNQVTANLGERNFYAIAVIGSIIVSGNLVCDNHTTGLYGAGICISGGSDATVENNIIVGNTGDWDGGGIYVTQSSPVLINNTIIDNSPKGIVGVSCTPIVINCILWGNADDLDSCNATYSDIEDGDPGEGNICEDPMFVDPAGGDYHLQAGSPCIDSGDSSAVLVATDLDGNPRIVGLKVDMGAFEAQLPDPVHLLKELAQQVIALNIQKGISNSLDAKLNAALQALDDLNENNNVVAINTLQAFINAVEAQRGKQIPEADADALIAAAQQIIDLLMAD